MPISRTHRPRRFSDVTGQRHVTETLRKEVSSGILGHAFLFSGPRGVGKTTTARIFAKALLNEKTEDGEPPIDSDASKEVDAGACIDLIELDAASHTGVENVRESIIEHVRFPPVRWGRKVYIIDECHMLSTSAWNALLKTLEEPPPYAFFVLATTELHKVPETIVSRCQRFEFHRIAPEDLIARVNALAAEEGIDIEDDVVRSIVHASDGCVRDAESLLDQLASLGTKKITHEIASLVLPTSRIPETAKLLATCLTRDIGASLAAVRKIVEEGTSPMDVLNDLLTITRALIRCEDASEKKRLETGDDGDKAILDLFGSITPGELGEFALTLIERRRDAKTGTDPHFVLELVILAVAGELLPSRHRQGASMGDGGGSSQRTPDDVKKAQSKTNKDEEAKIASRPVVPSVRAPEPEIMPEPPVSVSVNDVPITKAVAVSAGPIDLNDLRILWNTVIREVEKENRSLPFILKVAKPIGTEANRVTLAFAYDFHKEKIIDDMKMRAIVERAIASVLHMDFIIIEGVVQSAHDAPATNSSVPRDIVAKVLDTFGGEIVS